MVPREFVGDDLVREKTALVARRGPRHVNDGQPVRRGVKSDLLLGARRVVRAAAVAGARVDGA